MPIPLSDRELRSLISLAKRALWAGPVVHRELQSNGVNVTPANFYSSVPLVADIEESFEYAQEKAGIAPYASSGLFDSARIAGFVDSVREFAHEFDPPILANAAQPAAFYWGNPAFSLADAMLYYCIIRKTRPKRILEVGSGFSTMVADQALRANGAGELVLIEPYPKAFLRELATVSKLIEVPVQTFPEDELIELVDSSQIWFIDSTHTVKCGSDCLYLYLKIMPRLRQSVLCHSHDVFLPYAMPETLALNKHVYWTEQYLLLAYLLDNPKAEVLAGSCFLQRQLPELSALLMGGKYRSGGGSLWYRLDAGAHQGD